MIRSLPILLFFILALLSGTAQSAPLNVLLMLSDDSAPYKQFSTTFTQSLTTSRADVSVSQVSSKGIQPDLIVTVGIKATESALAAPGNTPVFSVMVPKSGYEAMIGKVDAKARPLSAIYIDQPLERTLKFIHALLPERHRLGLLYSSASSLKLAEFEKEASRLEFTPYVVQTSGNILDLHGDLARVLDNSDVLLAVPDSTIFNSSNLRNILLASYRQKVPLIGLSQAYVTAGALGAVYSTPEQIAQQGAEAVAAFALSRKLGGSSHPHAYSIGINMQVARSLGISPESETELRMHMDQHLQQSGGKKR